MIEITQDKWEETKLLERLTDKYLLTLETNVLVNVVCIDYLISSHELKKKFAILLSHDFSDKIALDDLGYNTLLLEQINFPMIEFLIEYIFRH